MRKSGSRNPERKSGDVFDLSEAATILGRYVGGAILLGSLWIGFCVRYCRPPVIEFDFDTDPDPEREDLDDDDDEGLSLDQYYRTGTYPPRDIIPFRRA